ncbi:MAG: hypothetical protein BRC28_02585 [Nanohaloarchaea archaeon SW_4_43_9]|nr:MAG: hypothetical protein BRC28_02585 [Nanohaloarchaea archaeon SW_4_43_9]
MSGKHKLTNSNVNQKVKEQIGVYKLYNSHGGPVRYVGMSDHVKDRLKNHTGDYSYFEVNYYQSERDAYERQGQLFHQHGGKKKLDNERHPPRPHKRVKCPGCGIHE